MRHDLKCWPEPFRAIVRRLKPYEVRRFDRPYAVNDELLLHEWIPGEERYTELAEEVGPEGLLFPKNDNWLGYHADRLCKAAGVTRVTPQGLRGTHASVARGAHQTPEDVARALGHGGGSGTRIAKRHYIDPSADAQADAERVAEVLFLPHACPTEKTNN